MEPRIAPLTPPFPAELQEVFDKIMPSGMAPLTLFTAIARDARLFERFRGGSLLDPGHLSLRQREIVIDRTTALCGSEYEWGVHVRFFGAAAELTDEQIRSLAKGGADDAVWTEEERALIRACDQLHKACDLEQDTWDNLRKYVSEEAAIEILMLAGFYRMVSYLTNALRLPCENYAARFPE